MPEVRNRAVRVTLPSQADQFLILNEGDTLYYSDNKEVSASSNEGSIANGKRAVLRSPSWIVSGGSSVYQTFEITEERQSEHLAVPISQYGVFFDGSDQTIAFQKAINESREKGVVLELPQGETTVSATLKVEDDGRPLMMVGQGKGKTIIRHKAVNLPLFEIKGLGPTALSTFSVAGVIGDTEITLGSTVGATANQLLLLRSKGEAIAGGEGETEEIEGGTKNVTSALGGDILRLEEVKSPTVLKLKGRLGWAYAEESDVRILDALAGVRLEGFTIKGELATNTSAAARGIFASRLLDATFNDLEFVELDGAGLYTTYCSGIYINNPTFKDMRKDTTNGYGIVAGRATNHGRVSNIMSRGGRHAFTTEAAATEIAPQHWDVEGGISTESQFAAYDVHPGARYINFYDCAAHNTGTNSNNAQGFQIRAPDCHLYNPTVIGCPYGVSFFDGADRGLVNGGLLRNCEVGVRVNDSNITTLNGGLRIEAPKTYGVFIETASSAWENHMTEQHLDDFVVTGTPAEFAVKQSTANIGCIVDLNRVLIPDATPTKQFKGITTFRSTTAGEQQRAQSPPVSERVIVRDSFNRGFINSEAITAPASKAESVFMQKFRKGEGVKYIRFMSGSTALVGGEHQFATIRTFSASKPLLLAKSKDKTNTAWSANSFQEFEFEEEWIAPEDNMFFVGLLVVAGTTPNLSGVLTTAKAASKGSILNGITSTGVETPASEGGAPSERNGWAYMEFLIHE